MLIPIVWKHGLARGHKHVPLTGIGKRGNGYRFAAVEPNQRRIHQIVYLHHVGKRVDVGADVLPNLGSRRGGKHGPNVNSIRRELEAEALRQYERRSNERAE